MIRLTVGIVVAVALLTACAQPLTPAQERAYQAVEDCAGKGLQRS